MFRLASVPSAEILITKASIRGSPSEPTNQLRETHTSNRPPILSRAFALTVPFCLLRPRSPDCNGLRGTWPRHLGGSCSPPIRRCVAREVHALVRCFIAVRVRSVPVLMVRIVFKSAPLYAHVGLLGKSASDYVALNFVSSLTNLEDLGVGEEPRNT